MTEARIKVISVNARYRVRSYNGDGIGCYGGKQEGDSCYQQNGYHGMQDVALHYIEIEEEYHEQQGEQRTEGDDFHGQILLSTFHIFFGFFAFISLAARLTALLMMPHERTIPMMPAMAIPPIPMLLAYSLKISSGDMSRRLS